MTKLTPPYVTNMIIRPKTGKVYVLLNLVPLIKFIIYKRILTSKIKEFLNKSLKNTEVIICTKHIYIVLVVTNVIQTFNC
jgi:hypothetical protein